MPPSAFADDRRRKSIICRLIMVTQRLLFAGSFGHVGNQRLAGKKDELHQRISPFLAKFRVVSEIKFKKLHLEASCHNAGKITSKTLAAHRFWFINCPLNVGVCSHCTAYRYAIQRNSGHHGLGLCFLYFDLMISQDKMFGNVVSRLGRIVLRFKPITSRGIRGV